jgi:hypothetical protein
LVWNRADVSRARSSCGNWSNWEIKKLNH